MDKLTPTQMDGYLNILKPSGMTSHDVVAVVRKLIGVRKVGHAGTLDPDAAGVLPLCIGKGTRMAEYMQVASKAYRGEMMIGCETDTQDASGEVIQRSSPDESRSAATFEAVQSAMVHFTGSQMQIPPMVSALKINGERLYTLARAGIEVKRLPRPIEIFHLELINYRIGADGYPIVMFDVECSKGTYIRTLASDLGTFMKVGAHLSYLLRTRSGPFALENASTLEELQNAVTVNRIHELIYPVDYPLFHLRKVQLERDDAERIRHGRAVSTEHDDQEDPETVRLYDQDGNFLAIGHKTADMIRPTKVITGDN